MSTIKSALLSFFNYFTPNDLNLHFASTVNRHPPITPDGRNANRLNEPPSKQPLFFYVSPTSAEKIQTAVQDRSAKSMGHESRCDIATNAEVGISHCCPLYSPPY